MAFVVSLLLAIFAMAFFTVQAQEFAPAPAPTSDGLFSIPPLFSFDRSLF